MGVIDEESIAKIIRLPEEKTVAALIVYGYGDEHQNAPARKDVEDIMRFMGGSVDKWDFYQMLIIKYKNIYIKIVVLA